MRVVLAPAAFAGELSAVQVGAAVAEGWAQAAPHDDLVVAPLSDGGLGFVEVVQAARGGDLLPVTVEGPLGGPVPGAVLLVGGVDDDPVTAYVEAADAAGQHLLGGRLAPTTATSYGVGQLLRAAVDAGARRIVVGVGGTGTNDGGAGLLAALGAGPRDALAAGGLALADLDPAALAGLADARAGLSGVELVLASATDVALLGFHGTSATYAEGKGATPEQAQQLEAALGRYADLASRSLVAGRSLMGRGLAGEPGSGAGGGIGFALLLLGARHVEGVQAVVDAAGLAELVSGSELVVTAEGTFDWESLRGGVVAAVAALGLTAGVPSVVLAAEVLVGRRESMTLGLAGTYAIAERPGDRPAAMRDPAAAIQARSARIARTWSRP
jgi:glycerate 2-kinase